MQQVAIAHLNAQPQQPLRRWTYFDADVDSRVGNMLHYSADRTHPRQQTARVGADTAAENRSVANWHPELLLWTADHRGVFNDIYIHNPSPQGEQ